MSNSNADAMQAGLAAAEAAGAREREDEKARRAAMEATRAGMNPTNPDQERLRAEFNAVMTSHDCVPSPESTYAAMPRDVRGEQQAEVIKRLDTINDSLQQMNATLRQLISLLSQGK